MSAVTDARRRAPRTRALTVGLPIAFGVLFIGLWYLTSAFLLSPSRRFILPMPHEVLVEAFLTPKNLLALLGRAAFWLFGLCLLYTSRWG